MTKDDDIFRQYHTYLRLERSYSLNTIEGYELDLQKLRAYTEEHQLDIVHISFEDLQEFVFQTFKDIPSPATQARVIAAIHSCFPAFSEPDGAYSACSAVRRPYPVEVLLSFRFSCFIIQN